MTVAEFPAVVLDPSSGADVRVPGSADGIFTKLNEAHTVRFGAKKGERLVVEVLARRGGSPVDPVIEILDAAGKPVPLGVLRDRENIGHLPRPRQRQHRHPPRRVERTGDRRLPVRERRGDADSRIPKGPDDDCQFHQVGGQRVAYHGTTPTHHSFGLPMYKVELHPPGKTFPPNGLPLFPLFYRNDDGGSGYGKDSRIFFDPPADGNYQVRVNDARGASGPTHAYRVTVRPPKPDFAVTFNPTAPSVWKAVVLPIGVTVTRLDGFDGPVDVELVGLPAGFSAEDVRRSRFHHDDVRAVRGRERGRPAGREAEAGRSRHHRREGSDARGDGGVAEGGRGGRHRDDGSRADDHHSAGGARRSSWWTSRGRESSRAACPLK